jgi:hypothetical protein
MPVASKLANGYVRIEFERTAENGMVFRDAIVVSQAQYDAWTPEQIELLEQERFDAWWAIVNAPSPEFPPQGFDYLYDENMQIVVNEEGKPYLVLVAITDPLPDAPEGYEYERDEEGNLVTNTLGQPILDPIVAQDPAQEPTVEGE